MMIDGHLDLAYNTLVARRDLTLPLEEVQRIEPQSPEMVMVTLPELRRGGVGVVFASIFSLPRLPGRSIYRTFTSPAEARSLAVEQLRLYEMWEEQRLIRIIRDRVDLERHVEAWKRGGAPIGVVLLMEGAEPLVGPEDVEWWYRRGVRIIGPAWRRTRYSGGTGEPGPLSPLGRELIREMNRAGVILDVSHMAEESFWQALELEPAHVIASHSNARAIVPSDRHLSDEMIRAIGERRGMIGLNMGNSFLHGGYRRGHDKGSVTLSDVAAHAEHMAAIAGWECIGIGSDFDGGFGRQGCPLEIERGSDFERLGEAVPARHRADFLGLNWLRWLLVALPGSRPSSSQNEADHQDDHPRDSQSAPGPSPIG